jgi:hypothetical protein
MHEERGQLPRGEMTDGLHAGQLAAGAGGRVAARHFLLGVVSGHFVCRQLLVVLTLRRG